MKFEITERIPEPVPELTVNLTLTTEELGLLTWAMNMSYDAYARNSDYDALRNDLVLLEDIVRGKSV